MPLIQSLPICEKDEREWTINLDELEGMPASYEQITIVPKARLQQVEAEAAIHYRARENLQSLVEKKHRRAEKAEDELSIAREALEKMADPARRRHVWKGDYCDCSWCTATQVLARLQAKEEGTDG
jgi:hypothetical protein